MGIGGKEKGEGRGGVKGKEGRERRGGASPPTFWPRTALVHYDVITCELAQRGVRHGAADASGGSGGVQLVWAWQRGRSDLDPRSTAVFEFPRIRPPLMSMALRSSYLSGAGMM